MDVKGFVFDCGGVLTVSSVPILVRGIVQEIGLPWDRVLSGFAQYRRDYDRGVLSLHGMYEAIWNDSGFTVSPELSELVERADTESWMLQNTNTVSLIRRLRSLGFKIGILTNMPPSMAAEFRVRYANVLPMADSVVISGEVGCVKPEPEIYRLVESELGLSGSSLAFVDDVLDNCEGARMVNWHAIRFESFRQVERELRDFIGTLDEQP